MSKSKHIAVGALIFIILLRTIFPRPKRKPKDDEKYYAKPSPLYFPLRILNQVDLFCRDFFGCRLINLAKGKMLKLAKEVPESPLFGPQEELIKGIETYTKGYIEANPSCLGVFYMNTWTLNALQKRKQVMEYVTKNPSIAEIPIVRPIIITGMPRTGSTLLFNLLHKDVNSRSPFLWEMEGTNPNPTPPPTSSNDPRIKNVVNGLKMYDVMHENVLKGLNASHLYKADQIEECLFILVHNLLYHMFLPVSGEEYLHWFLTDTGKEYAYVYLKRYLQMLTSGYAPRSHWTLKAPIHAVYFNQLYQTFPDASYVITHRNPSEVVASYCKLLEMATRFQHGENTLDRRWIGKSVLRLCEVTVKRMMEFRERNPDKESQFIDIRYDHLMNDPLGTVQKIYKHSGYEMTQDFEKGVREYLLENPQGKHGRNSYGLEEYFLNEQDIQNAFAEYIRKFLS